MSRVMAVWFERHGRLHYLDPGEESYAVGEKVLVPTEEGGDEVAECVWAPQWESEISDGSLPVCAGRASSDAIARDEANRRRRAEIRIVAKKLIRRHELPMKVVAVDHLDRSDEYDRLAVVYFSADGRVDFRALVGDLARSLSSRVDLRQIGSREAAKAMGGVGHCGRELCCSTFLTNFEPVTLRMARAQDLPPNPMRISGACGRLMCCLKYEHPLYAAFARDAPPVGSSVETPDGPGRVVGHSVPTDTVAVRSDETRKISSCSRASVCTSRQAYEQGRPS
ncbi:MAG: hypothetical protein L0G99_07715 [Propionibacteriales bacterium]|nr:hypothetical protein [Propionibacteriales bacterium]